MTNNIEDERKFDANIKICKTHSKTDGQARTCMYAKNIVEADEMLTISACDNGVLYDFEKYTKLLNDPKVDVIVWGKRGYQNAYHKPEMYGWIILGNKKCLS